MGKYLIIVSCGETKGYSTIEEYYCSFVDKKVKEACIKDFCEKHEHAIEPRTSINTYDIEKISKDTDIFIKRTKEIEAMIRCVEWNKLSKTDQIEKTLENKLGRKPTEKELRIEYEKVLNGSLLI